MTATNILLGTSSWSYREWEGKLYQKGEKRKLRAYANSSKPQRLIPPSTATQPKDSHWRKKADTVYTAAEKAGNRLLTAAEFVGGKNQFYESRRRQLYAEFPPSKEFQQWMSKNEAEISHLEASHIAEASAVWDGTQKGLGKIIFGPAFSILLWSG